MNVSTDTDHANVIQSRPTVRIVGLATMPVPLMIADDKGRREPGRQHERDENRVITLRVPFLSGLKVAGDSSTTSAAEY